MDNKTILGVEDLEQHSNGEEHAPLSLEQLDKIREQLLEKKCNECWKEIEEVLSKYSMRISCRVSVVDNNITENFMLILPK